MRRWLLSTLTLIILLSVLSGIAVYIGRQQPLPERLAMLHLDMCEPPCWIGIVPGKTTVGEARKKIEAIYRVNAKVNAFSEIYNLLGDNIFSIGLIADQETDSEIIIGLKFSFPNTLEHFVLSDILPYIDVPNRLNIRSKYEGVYIASVDDQMQQCKIGFRFRGRLGLTETVLDMKFYDPIRPSTNSISINSDDTGESLTARIPWRGFASTDVMKITDFPR